jgi:hypothetical protein
VGGDFGNRRKTAFARREIEMTGLRRLLRIFSSTTPDIVASAV